MFCSNCGTKVSPGTKFCPKCGSAMSGVNPQNVPERKETSPPPVGTVPHRRVPTDNETDRDTAKPVEQMMSKIPLPKNIILIIAAIAVVAVIGIIIVVATSGTGGGMRGSRGTNQVVTVTDSMVFFDSDGIISVVVNDNSPFTINGDMGGNRGSMDRRKGTLITDFIHDLGGTLWFVSASGATRVAEDVVWHRLSNFGDSIVYLRDPDEERSTASLYHYDTATGVSTLITQETFFNGWSALITLSPDGRTIAYVTDVDVPDPRHPRGPDCRFSVTGYTLTIGREPQRLGENIVAAILSDNAELIYYVRMDDNGNPESFHVRHQGEDTRLIPQMDHGIHVLLNADHTHALFAMDGSTFITKNGGERERFSRYNIQQVLGHTLGWAGDHIGVINVSASTAGISSFSRQVVVGSRDGTTRLFYINDEYEAIRIPGTEATWMAWVTLDRQEAIFLDNNTSRLSRVDLSCDDFTSEVIARNVSSYRPTSDLSTVYFVTENEELWRINRGEEDAVRISHDVHRHFFALSPCEGHLYFVVDFSERTGGVLFRTTANDERERVSGANEVVNLWATANNIFFRNVDGEWYRVREGGVVEYITTGHPW